MQQPKFPSIVHHKARGADVVFLRGPDGKRRQIYLCRHGSPEVQQRYREVMAAHLAGEDPEPRSPRRRAPPATSAWPTVAQLAAEFTAPGWAGAAQAYRLGLDRARRAGGQLRLRVDLGPTRAG